MAETPNTFCGLLSVNISPWFRPDGSIWTLVNSCRIASQPRSISIMLLISHALPKGCPNRNGHVGYSLQVAAAATGVLHGTNDGCGVAYLYDISGDVIILSVENFDDIPAHAWSGKSTSWSLIWYALSNVPPPIISSSSSWSWQIIITTNTTIIWMSCLRKSVREFSAECRFPTRHDKCTRT